MDTRIHIDRTQPLMTSRLAVGVTLNQITPAEAWEGTQEARDRANAHVEAMRGAWFNQHIAAWGIKANVLWPEPGKAAWADFDRRMRYLVDREVENVLLTCYGAPDWMTIAGKNPKYRMLAQAHEATYAAYCVEAIERAISMGVPVKAAQFWNELKGYGTWSGDWDIGSYTRAYNVWYAAIKARPALDHLLIAGPYLIIENRTATEPVITQHNLDTLRYWYEAALGGDAISVDHALSHGGTGLLSQAEYMRGVNIFTGIAWQIHGRYPGRLVWLAELYSHSDTAQYATLDPQFQAACIAACLAAALIGGVSLALSWGLTGDGRLAPGGLIASWLADTRALSSTGLATATGILPGDKTPLYDVYRAFHEHFGPGRPIYTTETSDPLIVVLASDTATMIINLHDTWQTVRMGTETFSLDRYEVKVLLEPVTPTHEERMRRIAREECAQLAVDLLAVMREERERVANALEAGVTSLRGGLS